MFKNMFRYKFLYFIKHELFLTLFEQRLTITIMYDFEKHLLFNFILI